MPRVHRVEPTAAGWTRRRRGRGFGYLDARGRPIRDPETLRRIKGLAIPPAWTDVWICPDPWGHLQAAGTDAAGRRQYMYHQRWREWRDRQKFRRMHRFASALPQMRETVARDLELPGLPRERVLACAVRLLDRGYFRVGSEEYTDQNGSYGLATLRKEHVRIEGEQVWFDYLAKGGKRRVVSVRDPAVKDVIRPLKARRGGGDELLAYDDGDGWRDVRSSDVNQYIKEVAGERFSAKDFRTWHATVLAAMALSARADVSPSLTTRRRAMSAAVKEVAAYLGNTPTVARASYIDPRVLDRFLEGTTLAGVLRDVSGRDGTFDPDAQAQLEAAVLDLVEGGPAEDAAAA
jgi:DNA topoisomerase IB